ncbi:hypothetical protein VVD49_09050 [Uliginosibacterium sp. H3]|uniref:Uncharacterized protein n=1 Tax=Uliginosibacterium silvisoli TaxID=3114758 RepID=A0ABU6K2J9_9RHOO|nr:hypothetical protein [Uliginosibacterium sp. H3]
MKTLIATLILATAAVSTTAFAQSTDPVVVNREATKAASKAYDERVGAAKKVYKDAVAAAKKTYDAEVDAAKGEKKTAVDAANKTLAATSKKNPDGTAK